MYCSVHTLLLVPTSHILPLVNVSKYAECDCDCMQHSIYLSLFLRPFSRWTWVSRYQNVPILDFIGARYDGNGSNNWSYKRCKAPAKSSPTNQHPVFLQAGRPSCRPTNSVRALEGKFMYRILYREKIRPNTFPYG